jgi:hypothetical protein
LQPRPGTYGGDVAGRDAGAALEDESSKLIDADSDPDREQLRILLLGFGTGLAIASVFLVYILLETAKMLP